MKILRTAQSRCGITLGLVLLLGAAGVEAQEPNASLVGTRVRVRTVQLVEPQVGVLEGSTSDSLVIRTSPSASPIQLRRADIVDFEASRGVKRHTLKGLLAGGIAWGVIAGLVAAFDTLDESGVGEPVFVGGLLAAGAAVGSMVRTERWERVDLGAGSARLAPRTGRLQARIVLRF
jgi:hypothetical protein